MRLLPLPLALSVTSCECERSICVLRRLKTYLRSSMAQERLKAFSHWNPMRIECAFNAHWEISYPMRIGANAHSKWIESTSAQSTSRGGLKWIEHLCAYGTTPDRNPRDASCVYRLEFSCLHELRRVWKHDGSWLNRPSIFTHPLRHGVRS